MNDNNFVNILDQIIPAAICIGAFLLCKYTFTSDLENNNINGNIEQESVTKISEEFDLIALSPNNITDTISEASSTNLIAQKITFSNTTQVIADKILAKISFLDIMIVCKSQFQDKVLFDISAFESSIQILLGQIAFLQTQVDPVYLYALVDSLIPVLINP